MDNNGYVIDCAEMNGGGGGGGKPTQREYSFEEAISMTGVGRFHYKLLLICGLCFMAVMVEIMGVSLIMPLVKCELQATLEQQGILASSAFLGVVLSSHAMGFLADTMGRVVLLRYALALSLLSSIVSAFAVNIWMLIVFRFLTGFFISGGQACVFSLCGEFHGQQSRVRHVTLLSCFMCLAMIFAPAVAIGILPLQFEGTLLGLELYSWRIFLLTDLSIILLALLGLCTLPETPKYQLVQGQPELALETMRRIYAENTGLPASAYPVQRLALQSGGASLSSVHGFVDAVRLIWQQTVPLFKRCRLAHTLNICFIQFAIYGIAQGIFMWFPTILNALSTPQAQHQLLCTVLEGMSPNKTEAAADQLCTAQVDTSTYQVMIIIGAFFTLLYLVFAYTIDYLGKRNLLSNGLDGIDDDLLVALHWMNQFALLVIGITIVMAIGNCGGLVSTIAMEFYPTQFNAMGLCFIMMVGRLGAVVGSNILGPLLLNSCDVTFWALLGVVVALCCMSYFLPDQWTWRSRSKANEKPQLTLSGK